MPDAAEIARLLIELGQRTALAGGNPYRARAFGRAAESLSALPLPLDRMIAEGRLQELPGVGAAIADIIAALQRTGTHPALEELRREVPAGVLEMLAIPGLRPEKVSLIYRTLGIASLAELEAAARADKLKTVKGLGASVQRLVLQGLEMQRQQPSGRHLNRAEQLLSAAAEQLLQSDLGIASVVPAGDFRRGAEIVADLALVAVVPKLAGVPEVHQQGELAVHLTDTARFGVSLILATGSAGHLARLRAHAETRNMALGEAGLKKGRRLLPAGDEAAVYQALGLAFIPPELREGGDEIARAASGTLPVLVEAGDLRGILHAHTTSSDGANTLEEMAAAVRQAGYEYFGVSDHSRSAHYAGGLSVAEIAAQHREIERLNAASSDGFRIFKGIESDILPDGSLDYPPEVLASFDFVVASVHGQFRMGRKEQTARLVRAVANPFTTILGHMTGRQLLRRPGYEVDHEEVFAACAANGVAIEINANPWRLDLDWRWHGRALAMGCSFSINPDAHSTTEIGLTRWGVLQARKGGVPKERVLNHRGHDAFARFLAARRKP